MKNGKNITSLTILVLLTAQICLTGNTSGNITTSARALPTADSIRPLGIGDRMPDLVVDMIRYKKNRVNISEFRGRLLILDFWSIWCGGCINALPKLEKLQQKFPDKLMVLPVSFTKTASQVEEFYRKQAGFGTPVGLPSAIYPSMKNNMLDLFPVLGFPLLVWISAEGKVLGITDSFVATEENIRKILSGDRPTLPLAELYRQKALSPTAPKPIAATKEIFSSTIRPYDDSLVSRTFKFKLDSTALSIRFDNASIVSLFKASLYGNDVEDFRNKKVIVDFPDSSRLFEPKADTSYYKNMATNTFCYKLIAPPSLEKAKAFELMNKQVSAYFGLAAIFQEREVDCLILGEIPGRKVIESKGGKVWTEEAKRGVEYILHNRRLSELAHYIQATPGSPLIFIGTNRDYNVDFLLERPDRQPVEKLNTALSQIGLELRPGKRKVRMVVISRDR